MGKTKLEKAIFLVLLAYAITLGITFFFGIIFTFYAITGFITWSVVAISIATGGALSMILLIGWFVLMMVDTMKEG